LHTSPLANRSRSPPPALAAHGVAIQHRDLDAQQDLAQALLVRSVPAPIGSSVSPPPSADNGQQREELPVVTDQPRPDADAGYAASRSRRSADPRRTLSR
jgi:hypothetical protein